MTALTLTAANVKNISCPVEHGVLGTTVTAGQVLYKDPADSKGKLADTDNASAIVRKPWGIALNGGGDGQPVAVAIPKDDGEIELGAVLTVGELYVLSATAGGIAPVGDLDVGHYTTVLGIARTTSRLVLFFASAGVAIPAP